MTPFVLVLSVVFLRSTFLLGDPENPGADSQVFQPFLFMAILTGLIASFRYRAEIERFVIAHWPLILLVAYTGATCLWSPYLRTSFVRWAQFAGIVIVLFATTSRKEGADWSLTLVRYFFAAQIIFSLLIVAAGINDSGDGRGLNGAFRHKNHLGTHCWLTIALWLPTLRWQDPLARTLGKLLLLATTALLLAKSGCATAQGVSLAILAAYLALRMPLPLAGQISLALFTAVLLTFCFMNMSLVSPKEASLAVFQRDTTLTGRTEIWEELMVQIQKHPLRGLGFNAFWDTPAETVVLNRLKWRPGTAHNGYLDMLNEIGILGGIIFAIFLVEGLRRSLTASNKVFALILIGCAVENVAETAIFRYVNASWVLMLLAFVLAHKGPRPVMRRAGQWAPERPSLAAVRPNGVRT